MEGERTMMDGRCADSDADTMVYLPARVICGKGASCSCLNVLPPREELASEGVGISSSMEVRQRPWDKINYTPIHYWCLKILTVAPVCADAKHSLPILDLCDRPTRKTFDFALISTASKTPETTQAEPSKLAKIEVL